MLFGGKKIYIYLTRRAAGVKAAGAGVAAMEEVLATTGEVTGVEFAVVTGVSV